MSTPQQARPHPPGDYPVVIVGSGPGGLQASHLLDGLGIRHAVLSADPGPGGMFRRFPFFQRLLSWTKPYAHGLARESRAFERYDWNSLLAADAENRGLMVDHMDGTSSFPSRPEMEAGLVRFAHRTGLRVRHDVRWEGTSRDADRFVLHTTDGDYRCRFPVFAVGVAEPYLPDVPGSEHIAHYVDTREASTYAGRRLFIVGKQNSGFELASGLLQWADRIILASPRPAQLSVNTHSLAGIRARYVQPWEDANLGGGVSILDASIDRYERVATGIRVHTRRSDTGEPFVADVDEVIAATGFVSPLLDLPALGVATFGASRLPMMTNRYESATLPGVFFAGTIGQGVAGLRKYGHPANSGAVHGARYNVRLMVESLAERHLGMPRVRPAVDPDHLVEYLLDELTTAPELWHQKSYLARAVSRDPDGVLRDEGVVSLAEYVDTAGPDGLAVTVETDAAGDIHPAIYIRRNGRVDADATLDGSPLHDYRTPHHRRALQAMVADLVR